MTLRRATERLREVGSLPLLLSALLLIAASGNLSAQDRAWDRANDSGDSRVAVAVERIEERAEAESPSVPAPSPPSEPASPSSPSETPETHETPDISDTPDTPSDTPVLIADGGMSGQDRSHARGNDSSDHGRTAVRSESAPRSSSPPPSSSPSSPSDHGSSSPRHAVPGSPGEAHRQPPSRDRNDPNDHGNWHGNGHGHGYGSFYYPYWYGPSWWWSPYGYWGWWWLGDNYWPYGPYYGDPYYHDHGSHGYGHGDVGALDLDVSPGRTQVYLDGNYIGTVDQYDGFPTYLWLDKGTYDIVFYLDGYKTVAHQVSVYPGTVIDFGDRLEPGQSVRPEDLASKSHERRDERQRYEQERRERIDRGEDPYDEEGNWRDRVSREREERRDPGEEIEIQDEDGRGGQEQGQGRVHLAVEPDDASVYLDGHFVGTGEDLARLRGGLLVNPGKHTLAVVRPGREGVEREFEVNPGEDFELAIALEAGQ